MPVQEKTTEFVKPPIYSFSALKSKQSEVKERGKKEIVHITEHGNAAYVFCSEEVLEREREMAAFEALHEEEIAQMIRDGRKSIAEGRYIEGVDEVKKYLHQLWGRDD